MLPHDQCYTHPLYLKFQKACRKLQQLLAAGKAVTSRQITVLIKRRNRYAKQLLSLSAYTLKAAAITGFGLLLTSNAQAQSCNTFVNADSANPVHRAGLPLNLIQPSFVDIDGDGDLDCYETSQDYYDGGHVFVKVTFLRNTGTAKIPYYEQDTANTFPKTPGTIAPFNATVTRLRFVDIDGDGDYDCFAGDYNTAQGRIQYFKNIGTAKKAKFVSAPTENPLGGIRGSYGLQFSFADFDGDGDYDVVVSDLYRSKIYKNAGTVTSPQFTLQQTSYAFFSPVLSVYDYNKDGRPDILDAYEGGINYYRNVGATGEFKFVKDKTGGPQSLPRHFTTFGFTDLNKDGVADAFSESGNYAVSTPVATINATPGAASAVTLRASPVNTMYTYQWYKDGKKINGAASPNYTATAAGKYVVEVTSGCGTGTSLPYVVAANALDQKTAIAFANTTQASPLLMAYPNPFTDHFTLRIDNAASSTVIKITDMQGRIISTIKANSSTMQLGSHLQKGVYIVQVIQNNTSVLTQKIIKQ